jgi:hypothetical protein
MLDPDDFCPGCEAREFLRCARTNTNIAAKVYVTKIVTWSQSSSVRRALGNLAKAGLIHDIGRYHGRDRYWLADRQYRLRLARAMAGKQSDQDCRRIRAGRIASTRDSAWIALAVGACRGQAAGSISEISSSRSGRSRRWSRIDRRMRGKEQPGREARTPRRSLSPTGATSIPPEPRPHTRRHQETSITAPSIPCFSRPIARFRKPSF